MIRTTFIAIAFVAAPALCAPAMAQPAMTVDPIDQAEKVCQMLKNPSLDQSIKDRLMEGLDAFAEPPSADANDFNKGMYEARLIVRARGYDK